MLLNSQVQRFFALFLLLTPGNHHTTTVLVIFFSASLSICNIIRNILHLEFHMVGNVGHTFVHIDCPIYYNPHQQADGKYIFFSVFL